MEMIETKKDRTKTCMLQNQKTEHGIVLCETQMEDLKWWKISRSFKMEAIYVELRVRELQESM